MCIYVWACVCAHVYVVCQVTESVIRDFADDNVRYLELRSTPRAVADTGKSCSCVLSRHTGEIVSFNVDSTAAIS